MLLAFAVLAFSAATDGIADGVISRCRRNAWPVRGVCAPMVFLLAAILVAQQPASSPAAPTAPDCHDDRMVNRCAEAEQRRVRQLYGLRPIEEHRDAGDQVRRVFFVDGYGRDLVAIAFVRARGHDPALWIHYPRREGEAQADPLQAPVPQDAWSEVLARSENFERSFAPPAGTNPGETNLCLHAWVYTIEATDPRQGSRPAALRRKIESACESGPGAAYAADLARTALSLIPHCAALDRAEHRNEAAMLAACRLLRGDRMAAAEVLNLAGVFRRTSTREEAGLIFGRFQYNATVNWNGARNTGPGSAMAFWLGRVFDEDRPSLFFESVEGVSADEVRLKALFHRVVYDSAGRQVRVERADVAQVWERDQGGSWQIASATVGPWEVAPTR